MAQTRVDSLAVITWESREAPDGTVVRHRERSSVSPVPIRDLPQFVSGVEVAVKPGKVAARNLHQEAMTPPEKIAGCPQVKQKIPYICLICNYLESRPY
jgi:hypothetical protein